MRDFLHHLFVPRHSNNHRSKLLHHESLLLSLALLVSTLIVIAGAERQYPAVLGDATSISVADLLTYTNIQRQAEGLPPLRLNDKLSQAAEAKAQDMFAQNYWAHVAPDGTTPWVFIKGAGYEYLYAGENLARGFDSGSAVVDAWMASPTHRENLLSPNYTDIGFAVESGTLTGTETVLVVQQFGRPYEAESEPEIAQTSEEVTVASSPAGIIIAQITPVPTVRPTNAPITVSEPQNQSAPGVASIQNQPLMDTDDVKNNIGFFFLFVFIGVLAIDAVIVERKKIARVFSHNLDHMLYLLFILLAGILIGRGSIL